MAISLSAAFFLFIIVIIMFRTGSLRPGGALAAGLFGFFLASTGMAPIINQVLQNLAATLGHIHF